MHRDAWMNKNKRTRKYTERERERETWCNITITYGNHAVVLFIDIHVFDQAISDEIIKRANSLFQLLKGIREDGKIDCQANIKKER